MSGSRSPLKPELVLAGGATLGEGPCWDHDRGVLIWVDIPAGAVHFLDPDSAKDRSVVVGQPVGAAVPCVEGGLVLALRDGFGHLTPEEEVEVKFDLAEAGMRMNDGKCAPDGSFWAGTMAEDHRRGAGSLYRLAPGWAEVEVVMGDLTISNGLGWSPDGSRMYFIDTPTKTVQSFCYRPGSAELSDRRVVVSVAEGSGNPDGMTVDEAGCLWVALAHAGRVQRFTPDGEEDVWVEVPVPQVTSCCFGGADLKTLFVTTGRRGAAPGDDKAGGVFAASPGVAGMPTRFYESASR